MSAFLKLVPTWAWVALAGLLLVGVQQLRVMGLQGEVATERQARLDDSSKLGACRTTRTNLLELTIEQNRAMADLRGAEQKRSARAILAQQLSEDRAKQSLQLAQGVLMEKTPAGADACTAASLAFDNELKRERGL